MSDKPKASTVELKNDALVKQHTRMAAGEKINGQKLPTTSKMPKTPA
jgi:hypothetical protein